MTLNRHIVQANYDRLSRVYDLLTTAGESHIRRQALAMLDTRPGERLLEIGCGTGKAMVELAKIAGCVVGVDLSPGMLAVAQRHIQHARLFQFLDYYVPTQPGYRWPPASIDGNFHELYPGAFPRE